MTFEQFVEHTKRTAVMQGRQFTQPDDDWNMTVLTEHAGDTRPGTLPIPAWVSNDGDAKRALGWALGQAARMTKPLKVGLIQSTWVVEYDPSDPDREPDPQHPRIMPHDHPNRIERLVVLVIDPEIQYASFADIHRRKRRPPILGPWVDFGPGGEAAGQLVDPLIEAMR